MSDKLPCDVLVQPHTLIKAGCSVNSLMLCIEMRRMKRDEGEALPPIISRTQADEIQSLRKRVERLEGGLSDLIQSCSRTAVGSGDGGTFVVGPPEHGALMKATAILMDAALSPKVQGGE